MKQILVGIFCCALLNTGCNKEKSENVTISGVIFGCKINGEIFMPNDWKCRNTISPINTETPDSSLYAGTDLRVESRR